MFSYNFFSQVLSSAQSSYPENAYAIWRQILYYGKNLYFNNRFGLMMDVLTEIMILVK